MKDVPIQEKDEETIDLALEALRLFGFDDIRIEGVKKDDGGRRLLLSLGPPMVSTNEKTMVEALVEMAEKDE